MQIEPIVTERLIIRLSTKDDAAFFLSLWGDRVTGKYLADPFYSEVSELSFVANDGDESDGYFLVVMLKETNERIGTCSIGPGKDPNEWYFGYVLHKEHWSQGYATEAAKAIIDFAYKKGARNFNAAHAIANAQSGRVLQKCGMHLDKVTSFTKTGTDITYPSHNYKMHLE